MKNRMKAEEEGFYLQIGYMITGKENLLGRYYICHVSEKPDLSGPGFIHACEAWAKAAQIRE